VGDLPSSEQQTDPCVAALIEKVGTPEDFMSFFLYHHLLFPSWDVTSREFNVIYQQFKSELNRHLLANTEKRNHVPHEGSSEISSTHGPSATHTSEQMSRYELRSAPQSSQIARSHTKEALVVSSQSDSSKSVHSVSTCLGEDSLVHQDSSNSTDSHLSESFFPHELSHFAHHDPLVHLMLKVWREKDTTKTVPLMKEAFEFAQHSIPHCQQWFLWFCMGRCVPQSEQSLQCYTKALELNPNCSLAFYNQGLAFDEMQQFEDARRCYENALLHDPALCDAANNLGTLHKDYFKRYDEARKCYEQALQYNPSYIYALNNLGLLYDEVFGDPQKAFQLFSRCIEIAPTYALSYYNRANMFEKHRMKIPALRDYTRSLQLNDKHASSWNNRAVVHECLNMFTEAIHDYSMAIEVSASDQSSLARENLSTLMRRIAGYHCMGNV